MWKISKRGMPCHCGRWCWRGSRGDPGVWPQVGECAWMVNGDGTAGWVIGGGGVGSGVCGVIWGEEIAGREKGDPEGAGYLREDEKGELDAPGRRGQDLLGRLVLERTPFLLRLRVELLASETTRFRLLLYYCCCNDILHNGSLAFEVEPFYFGELRREG